MQQERKRKRLKGVECNKNTAQIGGGALEVAGGAKTTTEAEKRLSMGGEGTLEVAGSAKTTTEAEKRLSKGGSATKIRLNGGGGSEKWFKGEVCTRLLI